MYAPLSYNPQYLCWTLADSERSILDQSLTEIEGNETMAALCFVCLELTTSQTQIITTDKSE